jgi:hypothetical protein
MILRGVPRGHLEAGDSSVMRLTAQSYLLAQPRR